jgi:hypothetical protein
VLLSQTTLASGFPYKVYGMLDADAHNIPGEHVISNPSGKYLAATGAEGKSRYKLTQANYSSRLCRSQNSLGGPSALSLIGSERLHHKQASE